MVGESILVRSISETRIDDQHGNTWQYHSRSDRHSKVACWAILFDLLRSCSLLREHVRLGKIGFGINHEMRDFKQNRKKNLDLVLCRMHDPGDLTFAEYGSQCAIVLNEFERHELMALPALHQAPVNNVLLALEAKACMTAHIKALPRLYDELASSHQCIHGDTGGAIAAGFAMVNCAETFVSPGLNRRAHDPATWVVSRHQQPRVAERTLEALMKLPRRANDAGVGFDAFGITMVSCRNDGTAVTIDVEGNKKVDGIVKHESFIRRIEHLYSTKFSGI